MKALLMMLVRAYRLAISPLFPPRCRFLPSCSDYALQAVERHGAVAGGWLALRRFARCHPFNPGGIDEVPERLDAAGQGPGVGLGSRLRRLGCQCHRPFNR
jgi:putative membrane protein insertion efficiency factor